MAKNRLLFTTPRNGVLLRPGTRRLLTAEHGHHEHHGHHDHHHHHHHHDHHDHHDHHHHHHHHRRAVDVRGFETIRVFLYNRVESVSCVYFIIYNSDKFGNNLGTLDKVKLAPGESYTNVFLVPGRYLSIEALASRKFRRGFRRGADIVDAAVYGHK